MKTSTKIDIDNAFSIALTELDKENAQANIVQANTYFDGEHDKDFAFTYSKKRRSSASSARSMKSEKKPRKIASKKGVLENKKSEVFVMRPRECSEIKPPIKGNGKVEVSANLNLNVHFDMDTASSRRNNHHWPIEAGIREMMGRLYSITSHYYICFTFNTLFLRSAISNI